MFARCRRMVDACEQILDDEVYHYHSKMIMKDAKVGGAWTWHQDYGYWYQNGVLFPDLVSVFIAVDPCTKENGCLQVIRGSHRLGRIDHVLTGQQAGADTGRVEEVLKRLPLVHVEMNPGDALFFHPNLLHRSDRNTSDHPRWSMICCYNARHNDPFKEAHHPRYTPLTKVDDRMIREVGIRRFADDPTDVAWLDPTVDVSPFARPGLNFIVGSEGISRLRRACLSHSRPSLAVFSMRGGTSRGARGTPSLTGPDAAKPSLIVAVGVECRMGSGHGDRAGVTPRHWRGIGARRLLTTANTQIQSEMEGPLNFSSPQSVFDHWVNCTLGLELA